MTIPIVLIVLGAALVAGALVCLIGSGASDRLAVPAAAAGAGLVLLAAGGLLTFVG